VNNYNISKNDYIGHCLHFLELLACDCSRECPKIPTLQEITRSSPFVVRHVHIMYGCDSLCFSEFLTKHIHRRLHIRWWRVHESMRSPFIFSWYHSIDINIDYDRHFSDTLYITFYAMRVSRYMLCWDGLTSKIPVWRQYVVVCTWFLSERV
jgi:hypothetical protein